MGTTLYQKIWDAHAVSTLPSGETLLYIDRHLVHEVTSAQAFEGLRLSERTVRRPDLTFATADHNVPTDADRLNVKDILSRTQIETLKRNCAEFGVPYYGLESARQGIVHIIGPELGITLPGQTMVCGDSHTSTHGAFGSLAFGIGTSEVEHVLATQTLRSVPSKTYSVEVNGTMPLGVTAKDVILRVIRDIGTGGATRQPGREEVLVQRRQRAEREAATLQPGYLLHHAPCLCLGLQDALRLREQRRPRVREGDAAPLAMEQRRP